MPISEGYLTFRIRRTLCYGAHIIKGLCTQHELRFTLSNGYDQNKLTIILSVGLYTFYMSKNLLYIFDITKSCKFSLLQFLYKELPIPPHILQPFTPKPGKKMLFVHFEIHVDEVDIVSSITFSNQSNRLIHYVQVTFFTFFF